MSPARLIAVVGGASGIGASTARTLAAAGDSVIILDRDGEAAAALAAAIGARALTLDVADADSVARAFAALEAPLYGLVVSSGVVDTGKLASLDVARWNEILAVNLTGVFLCCRAASPLLAEGGRIVTLGSLAARTGGVITGAAYAASKAGVEALTKSMAQELAPRSITVNCVSPGAIDTPMTARHPAEQKARYDAIVPLRRHGRAEEVAAAIRFLLSEEASYLTGAVIPVNGGVRMD
jgi:NAD(P)-dependent dehydrogenase (short-subunit alcohol dehydrogenase family)